MTGNRNHQIRGDGHEPGISVVIPVYNAELYLTDAIESVLGQIYTNYELIIIDDGSTDRSREIVRRFAETDPRIVPLFRGHRAVAATRNEALDLAAGDYIAFLDADDIAEPDRLALQHAHLESHPDCVAVGGQLLFIDCDGDPLFHSSFPVDHDAIDRYNMSGSGCSISQGAATLRRGAMLEVGGYRTDFAVAEDLDLFLRLAEIGRLSNLERVVIRYRQHAESLTHTHLANSQRFATAAIRQAEIRRGSEPRDISMAEPRPRTGASELMFRAMRAHRSGFQRTARKYARRSLAQRPFDPTAWRVALTVALGRDTDRGSQPTERTSKIERKRGS